MGYAQTEGGRDTPRETRKVRATLQQVVDKTETPKGSRCQWSKARGKGYK